MTFPLHRLRRLRKNGAIRRLISETTLNVDDFVAPLFVREGITEAQPIASLPGIFQHTRESLKSEIDEISFTHKANNRKGFALGAVLAAEFLKDKTGVYQMKDLIKF